MKGTLLIILLICIVLSGLNAQERFIEKYSFSMCFGARSIACDSFPDNENLDFLNYLYNAQGGNLSPDYGYLGMASHLWLAGNWEIDIKLSMYDDFIPDQMNISVQYFPLKYLGFNFGINGYSQLMNEYNQYHHNTDTGYYGDIDPNYRQRSLYDLGIIGGPVLAIQEGRFSGIIKLNAGFGTFLSFSESISQKKINSNFRREFIYSTELTPSFFFFPELALGFALISFPNSILGIQLQASFYIARRSIDYSRETLNWTNEYPFSEKVISPVHPYSKFDIDVGFYLRFSAARED